MSAGHVLASLRSVPAGALMWDEGPAVTIPGRVRAHLVNVFVSDCAAALARKRLVCGPIDHLGDQAGEVLAWLWAGQDPDAAVDVLFGLLNEINHRLVVEAASMASTRVDGVGPVGLDELLTAVWRAWPDGADALRRCEGLMAAARRAAH